MDQIRDNLVQANELIQETIEELEENYPIEIQKIDTLKEKRIEIGGMIKEIDLE